MTVGGAEMVSQGARLASNWKKENCKPIQPYTHTAIHPYSHTPIQSYTHTVIHPYTHTAIWSSFDKSDGNPTR